MTNTLNNVFDALNSERAYDYGFSNKDAKIVGNKVVFTYPAPVIAGACIGEIVVNEDETVYDGVLDQLFPSFEMWLSTMDVDVSDMEN